MTSETSVVIQPIDKTTVNRICSGQVVLNLATAVKELLENSVDAKATNIQIRLKEYGSELIEVSDNGCGVEEVNFQALTLKHYTSKISDFADVYSVETFGFRGEALSSLCALSDVTIITRHSSVPFGMKLRMDHNGIITEKVKTARQVGTTVMLENVFSTLPVRHKEFLRNVKKEFTKMCGVLYAYGLQACGISISCINQTSSRKIPVMETRGESVKSNIACIFGIKQSQNLFEIKETNFNDEVLEEYNIKRDSLKENQQDMFKLEGYISSCAHGCGRSTADRQFYYINSRPVDNPKISKLVNEVYHQYDPHQYPFVVLNIKVSLDSVDVNVTPDKRQIMLDNEKLLLALLKSTLKDLFQNVPATLNVQNAGLIKSNPAEGKESQGLLARLQKFRSNYAASNDTSKIVENKKNLTGDKSKNSQSSLDKFIKYDKRKEVSACEPEYEELTPENITEIKIAPVADSEIFESKPIIEIISPENNMEVETEPTVTVIQTNENHISNEDKPSEPSMSTENISSNEELVAETKKRKIITESNSNETTEKSSKRKKIDDSSEDVKPTRKTINVSASIDRIKRKILMKKNQAENPDKKDVKFFAEINPGTNESAEKELKKELTKPMFKKMEIIGQFNLGFIIAKLGPDIFIVDQHATDEKYNFETLQLNTVIQTQKLVIPQNLELTVEKEELLLQHADVIRKNGFDFTFDDDAGPTKRVKLTSIPLSKNWIFGKSDIDELLFMLEDAPDSKICRPSRVRDMFASRACRKSVMIGTALNQSEMRRLIDHMGEIEQPWNCPHGRPTIRHLINLNMIYQQHE